MELWIKTQTKIGLFKVDNIYIDERDFGNDDIEYYIQTNMTELGKYKTKEKALEVLDEIQSLLKQQFIVKSDMKFSQKDIDKEENRLTWKYNKEFIMEDSGFEIFPINNVVIYEMPKENKYEF